MGSGVVNSKYQNVAIRIENVKKMVGEGDFSVYDHRYNVIANTKREDAIARTCLSNMSSANMELLWSKLFQADGAVEASREHEVNFASGLGSSRFLTDGDINFTDLLGESFKAKKEHADARFTERINIVDTYQHYQGDGRGRRKYYLASIESLEDKLSAIEKALKSMDESHQDYEGKQQKRAEIIAELKVLQQKNQDHPDRNRRGSFSNESMGITQQSQMTATDTMHAEAQFSKNVAHGKGLKRRESHSDISHLMFEQDMPFIGGVSGSTKEFIMNMEMTENETVNSSNLEERNKAIAAYMMCMVNGGHHSIGEMLITAQLLGYLPNITPPLQNYKRAIDDFARFAQTLSQ